MTVEIRELVIKTEIKSAPDSPAKLTTEELIELKEQMIAHCKRLLKKNAQSGRYNR